MDGRFLFEVPMRVRLLTSLPSLNDAIQTWWDSMCDFDKGDMVLCVGAF